MKFFTNRFFLIGSFVFILLSIPLTLFLLRDQLQFKSKAAATTVLSIDPATKTVKKGDTFTVDVKVTPNQNAVHSVGFALQFDPAVLEYVKAEPSEKFTVILNKATAVGSSLKFGVAVGTPIENAVKEETSVATITFKALATTTTPSRIIFDETGVYILSNAKADVETENVFQSSNPGLITVTESGGQPALSGTPTLTPTPTKPQTTQNQIPICTALNLDRAATGNAPYSITYTVIGSDPDGTIQKITFNPGDGATQDITVGGGIGTKNVSTQISHTYNNPGTYTVTTQLTDNNTTLSVIGACSKTVTINQAATTQTTQVVVTTQPKQTLPPTGSITETIGIIAGILITIGTGAILLIL